MIQQPIMDLLSDEVIFRARIFSEAQFYKLGKLEPVIITNEKRGKMSLSVILVKSVAKSKEDEEEELETGSFKENMGCNDEHVGDGLSNKSKRVCILARVRSLVEG
ncbi:uncharacterized protein [Rutidosis leptorrhynchoides]|uniref:uncharacterized protein isoform X2 n=1 Tax=Rutidosis leptorrhynchoides TaxID=125765 RepID=UPI003A9A42C4